ncbi:MAG: hypothetical protein Q9163_005317 [Psora crenata]
MAVTRKSNGIVKPNRKYMSLPLPNKVKAKPKFTGGTAVAQNRAAQDSPSVQVEETVKGKSQNKADKTRKGISRKGKATVSRFARKDDTRPSKDEGAGLANEDSTAVEEKIPIAAEGETKSLTRKAYPPQKRVQKSATCAISKQSSAPKNTSKATKSQVPSVRKRPAADRPRGDGTVGESEIADGNDTTLEPTVPTKESSVPEQAQDILQVTTTPTSNTDTLFIQMASSGVTDEQPKHTTTQNPKSRAAGRGKIKKASSTKPVANERTKEKLKLKPTKALDGRSDGMRITIDTAPQADQSSTITVENLQNNVHPKTVKRKLNATNAAHKKRKYSITMRTDITATLPCAPPRVLLEPPKKLGHPSKKGQDKIYGSQSQEVTQSTSKAKGKSRVQDPSYRHPAGDEDEDEADQIIERAAPDPSISRLCKRPRIQDSTYRPQRSPQSEWSEPSPQSDTHASVHPARDSRSFRRSLWKAPTSASAPKAYANDLRGPQQKGRVRDPDGPRIKRSGSLEWIHERSPPPVGSLRMRSNKSRKGLIPSKSRANRKTTKVSSSAVVKKVRKSKKATPSHTRKSATAPPSQQDTTPQDRRRVSLVVVHEAHQEGDDDGEGECEGKYNEEEDRDGDDKTNNHQHPAPNKKTPPPPPPANDPEDRPNQPSPSKETACKKKMEKKSEPNNSNNDDDVDDEKEGDEGEGEATPAGPRHREMDKETSEPTDQLPAPPRQRNLPRTDSPSGGEIVVDVPQQDRNQGGAEGDGDGERVSFVRATAVAAAEKTPSPGRIAAVVQGMIARFTTAGDVFSR